MGVLLFLCEHHQLTRAKPMADILFLQYLHFRPPWRSKTTALNEVTREVIKQKSKNVPEIFWHALLPWRFQQTACFII